MSKQQEYLDNLIQEIETAKLQSRNGIFKIREKMDDSTAIYARDYLKSHTPYRIEFKKCTICAFEWDILIIF
jgi:hypothetical protein